MPPCRPAALPLCRPERLGDPADWEALAEIEGLTNDRIRQEIGDISVVPVKERVSGPGAAWVMASFTHLGRPSRFSDGSYGVYYAARQRRTAVAKTAYHMGLFYAATGEEPLDVEMRVLVGRVDAALHDIRGGGRRWRVLHDPRSYAGSQSFGRVLREAGASGVVYDSVRDPGGECVGTFRPNAVGIPVQAAHLTYPWDGARIDRVFDHTTERWMNR